MTEPIAARPYMPGYGTQPATAGSGLLPPASNSVFSLRPEWVFALDSRDFTGSPTRFTFRGDTAG